MALTKCRECGGQVSTEAATCPHCGAPQSVATQTPSAVTKSTYLRNFAVIVAAVLGVIILAIISLIMFSASMAPAQTPAQSAPAPRNDLCTYADKAVKALADAHSALQSANSAGNISNSVSELKRISASFQSIPVPSGGATLSSDVINTIVAAGAFTAAANENTAAAYLTMIDKVTADVGNIRTSYGCVK